MPLQPYREALGRVTILKREKKLGEALCVLEELLREHPHSSELLVQRAMLQQLASGDHSLEDIECDLRAAQLLAPSHPAPQLELGHFLYAVRDSAKEALPCFHVARGLAAEALKEALLGEIKCHLELRAWSEVEEALAEAERLFPGDLELALVRAERDELAELAKLDEQHKPKSAAPKRE
uniref:Uncharacterized protein n=1 Tax=uncultured bacterium A1Q1_fos_1870 TaxID=1256554 RepID=L7W1U8_9BACT|nr:hypothetical protein [uncultured bacterium A1Q1_fos_1870]